MAATPVTRDTANAAYRKGDYAQALEQYTTLLERDDDAGIRLNRAAAHVELGRFVEALNDLVPVLATSESTKAWLRAGRVLTHLLLLDEAETAYNAAAAMPDAGSGGGVWDSINTGRASIKAARSAVSSLDGALLARPLPQLIDEHVETAGEAAAEAALAACVAVPNHPGLLTAAAVALLAARRYETAAEVGMTAQRLLDGGHTWLWSCGAGVRLGGEGSGGGSGGFTLPTSAPWGASLPTPWSVAAHAWMVAGEWHKAVDAAHVAVRVDPDITLPTTHDATALIKAAKALLEGKEAANELYKAGRFDDAVAAYQALMVDARSRLGYVPSILHANLAAAWVSLGDHASAHAACTTALRLAPFSSGKVWVRRAGCSSSMKPADHAAAAVDLIAAQFTTPADTTTLPGKLLQALTRSGEDGSEWGVGVHHADTDAEASKLLSSAGGASKGAALMAPLFSRGASGPGGGRGKVPSPSHRLQVIDVFATWCGPCKAIAPVFEKLASSYAVPAWLKIDGDKASSTAAGLGVRAFPTFIVRLDGVEIGRLEGADPRKLEELAQEGIAAWAAAGMRSRSPASGGAGKTPPSHTAHLPAEVAAALTHAAQLELHPEVVAAVARGLGMA